MKKDRKINNKEANDILRKLNMHAKSFVKVLGIGKAHNQGKHAVVNVTVHENCEIPLLTGAEKDKKKYK